MTLDGLRTRVRQPNPYADVQVQLTALCFQRLIPVVASGLVMSLCVTGVLAIHYHDPWFWKMVAILFLLGAVRLGLVSVFFRRKSPEMTPEEARSWETVYGVATIAYVTAASVVTISTMHQQGFIALNLTTLGTFAYVNAISARLSLRPWIAKVSGLIMMGGLGVALLGSFEAITRYSVVVLAIYAFFYCDAIQAKYDILVEQLRLKRKLQELAEHDPLTGLANRRQFQARLAQLCQQPVSFAVLFMDLDGFKKVNDTHGHGMGDILLQRVAERLGQALRHTDLLARLGGDEFAVLHTPDASQRSAQTLAIRFNRLIAEPFLIEGQTIRIGTSIGVQLSSPHDSDPRALLNKADEALYRVKKAGGRGFYFADSRDDTLIAVSSAARQDAQHGVGKLLVRVGE